MSRLRATILGLTLGIVLPFACRAAPMPAACAPLVRLVDATSQTGPEFLPSYPGTTQPALRGTAYLYDNALTIIALLACHQRARAERLGAALRIAARYDRFWHDGRLRNAYRAGPVAPGHAPPPPGWWDPARKRWVEDGYAVGSASGNMGWAALALLWLAPDQPHPAARRILGWVARVAGAAPGRGFPGGFLGGFLGEEPTPARLTFRATEQNTTLAVAFARLGMPAEAARAAGFVASMWQPGPGRYGIGMNGSEPAQTPIVLDAQLLPVLAGLASPARQRRARAYVMANFISDGGYGFAEGTQGLWAEGTALAALTLPGPAAHSALATLGHDRAPDGLPYATNLPQLRTLLGVGPGARFDDFRYYHLPSLAAGAFAALAATGTNPYQPLTIAP